MSDQKPSRQERFARCFDAIAAYLRRKEPDQHLVPGEPWETEESAMFDILSYVQRAMCAHVRGDVLDLLEDCEREAEKLKRPTPE